MSPPPTKKVPKSVNFSLRGQFKPLKQLFESLNIYFFFGFGIPILGQCVIKIYNGAPRISQTVGANPKGGGRQPIILQNV